MKTKYDNILAGGFPHAKESVLVGGGKKLPAGSLMGKKSAVLDAVARKVSVTLAGTAVGSAEVSVIINGDAYAVATTAADTAAAVATALAANINGDGDALCTVVAIAEKLELTFKQAGSAANSVAITAASTDSGVTAGDVVEEVSGRDMGGSVFVLCDSEATDGSETAVAVLLEDVDATDADVGGVVSFTGEFNELEMTFGGSDTADTHRDALRARGIFLKQNVGVAEEEG